MPNEKDKNDFDIREDLNSPEVIEKRKKAEEKEKAAERKMKAELEARKENRRKMNALRADSLRSAKETIEANARGTISTKEFIRKASGVYGFFVRCGQS